MKIPALVLVAAVVAAVGCRPRPRPPVWMQGVPAQATVGVSGNLGWLVQQPLFQRSIAQVPMAEQALDLFLSRARINPGQETGHLAFFLVGDPVALAGSAPKDPTSVSRSFLLNLSGFRDPKALMSAMADAFPCEGSLSVKGRDFPLHVIMDINQVHLRAFLDDRGQIWIGDLQALATLGTVQEASAPVTHAGTWLTPGAPLQGFLDLRGVKLPNLTREAGPMAFDLPKGLEAVAFSVTPLQGDAHRLELVVSGRPEAIQATLPWLQRVAAGAATLQEGGGVPELFQEKDRVVLRCTLRADQVQTLLARLSPQFAGHGARP